MIIHRGPRSYMSQAEVGGVNVAKWLSWCTILSVVWISKPLEIPIALLAPFVLLLVSLINPCKIYISLQYASFFLLSVFFLLTHYFLDHLDSRQLGWQFMRVSLPLFGLMLFSCHWKSMSLHGRHIFRKNAIIGSTILLGLEAVVRVVAYPGLAIGSIFGDLIALYDFKSASFLFQDGNVCAFISTYFLCYILISKINAPASKFGDEISIFWQLVLVLIVYLSFSRQAWFTLLSSLAIYYIYRFMERSAPRLSGLVDSPLVMIAFIACGMIIILFPSQDIFAELGEINQDSFGSASTKFAIAAYTALFFSEATALDIVIGIGPQNVIDKNVISYVGHSLIGLFPEFGLSLILVLFVWFRKVRGNLVLLPLFVGATFSLYPFAYLLPVYILHSTLPRVVIKPDLQKAK